MSAQPHVSWVDMDMLSQHAVLYGRTHLGMPCVQVLDLKLKGKSPQMHVVRPEAPTAKGTAGAHRRKRDSLSTVPLPPWALSVVPGANADPAAQILRLVASSPVHPPHTYDYCLDSGQLHLVHVQPAYTLMPSVRTSEQPGLTGGLPDCVGSSPTSEQPGLKQELPHHTASWQASLQPPAPFRDTKEGAVGIGEQEKVRTMGMVRSDSSVGMSVWEGLKQIRRVKDFLLPSAGSRSNSGSKDLSSISSSEDNSSTDLGTAVAGAGCSKESSCTNSGSSPCTRLHDPSQYCILRLYAPSYDGVLVPITVVFHAQFQQLYQQHQVQPPLALPSSQTHTPGAPVISSSPYKVCSQSLASCSTLHQDQSQQHTGLDPAPPQPSLLPPPLLLHVYGAYGTPLDPSFEPADLSLLERGFLVAYAHVRGGGELGRAWHAAGRQRNKPNSLHDLNTCLTALHQAGFAHPGRVAGHAFSAGGLLLGCALADMHGDTEQQTQPGFVQNQQNCHCNHHCHHHHHHQQQQQLQEHPTPCPHSSSDSSTISRTTSSSSCQLGTSSARPRPLVHAQTLWAPSMIQPKPQPVASSQLFPAAHLLSAAVLRAPFLDLLSVMEDPSLPLTVHEYDEWGDARDPSLLPSMQNMCPYSRLSSTLLQTTKSDHAQSATPAGHGCSSGNLGQSVGQRGHGYSAIDLGQSMVQHVADYRPLSSNVLQHDVGQHTQGQGGDPSGQRELGVDRIGSKGAWRHDKEEYHRSAETEAAFSGRQAPGSKACVPAVLMTSAMDDARVPVWVPAKWAARARRLQQAVVLRQGGSFTKPPLVLLRVYREGGHFMGSSLAGCAEEYAFIIAVMGAAWSLR